MTPEPTAYEAALAQVVDNIHLIATSHMGLHPPGHECPTCRWSVMLMSAKHRQKDNT